MYKKDKPKQIINSSINYQATYTRKKSQTIYSKSNSSLCSPKVKRRISIFDDIQGTQEKLEVVEQQKKVENQIVEISDSLVFKKDLEEVNEGRGMANWQMQQSNMRKSEEVKQLEAKIESSSIKQREFFKNNASEVKIYATKMDLFACEKGNIKKTLAILEQEELFEPAHLFTTNKGLIFIFQKEQAIEILNIVFSSISKYMLSGNFFLLSFDGKKQRESLAVKIEKDQEIKKWFEFIKVNMELIHSPQVSRVSKWCDIGLKSKLSNDSESGKESPSQNYLNRKQKSKEKKEEMPKNKLIQGSLIKQERESDAVESNRKGSESISKKPTGILKNKLQSPSIQGSSSLHIEQPTSIEKPLDSPCEKLNKVHEQMKQLLDSTRNNFLQIHWIETQKSIHQNQPLTRKTEYTSNNSLVESIRTKNKTNQYQFPLSRKLSKQFDLDTSQQPKRKFSQLFSMEEMKRGMGVQKTKRQVRKMERKIINQQYRRDDEQLQESVDVSWRKSSISSNEEQNLHVRELKNGLVLWKCSPNGWQPHEKKVYLAENQVQLCYSDILNENEKKIFLPDIDVVEHKNYGKGIIKHMKGKFKPENCVTITFNNRGKKKTIEFMSPETEGTHFVDFCQYLTEFLDKRFPRETE